jgi:hypothetical protein
LALPRIGLEAKFKAAICCRKIAEHRRNSAHYTRGSRNARFCRSISARAVSGREERRMNPAVFVINIGFGIGLALGALALLLI